MTDDRPSWDDYFLSIACLISQRSIDPQTKHGCVITFENSVLSTGYNGPPAGCIDDQIPLNRPFKYSYLEHSESNSITNAAKNGMSINNSTFYITGPPCAACLRKMINAGAVRIVCGPIKSQCIDEQEQKIIDHLLKMRSDIEVVMIDSYENVFGVIDGCMGYLKKKRGAQKKSDLNPYDLNDVAKLRSPDACETDTSKLNPYDLNDVAKLRRSFGEKL